MDTEIEQRSLPPPDTGRAAWLVLAGYSLIQAPVWGYSLSFGVFQEYYSSHPEEIDGDTANVAVIGAMITGILYLSSPLIFTILTRWPKLHRFFGPIGPAMAAVRFLISSFVAKVWQLIATQGLLSALGCGLLFTPTTLYLNEWFIRRKGLAYGIMWAGKSITRVGLPLAMEASLHKYGPRVSLQAWTVAASLGYFLPYTYLSSYAVQEVGASTKVGALALALVNVTSIPGGIVLGSMNDHFNVTTVILVSALGSTLAVFSIFSITYGFFAGGFSSTSSGLGGRGIGNVISGPLSVAMIMHDGWFNDGKGWGYSGEYGSVILFTGATSLLGAWGWLRRFWR
ncbi:MFS general substrate transporter [Lojkania enalia]|uniref:MFS general substrate transporter n=1 Tax=Lojkania enalia TaxID=147567 RepID=A0A9P4K8H5_9PLEO|nr:MFS general substrate transporter [Didymosphaeria enalia]